MTNHLEKNIALSAHHSLSISAIPSCYLSFSHRLLTEQLNKASLPFFIQTYTNLSWKKPTLHWTTISNLYGISQQGLLVCAFSTKAIPTQNESSVWVEGTLTAPLPRMEQGHGHRPAARSPVQHHTLQQRLRPLAVQLIYTVCVNMK